jgi:hypothetical protein
LIAAGIAVFEFFGRPKGRRTDPVIRSRNSTNGEAASLCLAACPAFRLAQTGPLTAYSQPEAARTGFSKAFWENLPVRKKIANRDITSRRWLTGEI